MVIFFKANLRRCSKTYHLKSSDWHFSMWFFGGLKLRPWAHCQTSGGIVAYSWEGLQWLYSASLLVWGGTLDGFMTNGRTGVSLKETCASTDSPWLAVVQFMWKLCGCSRKRILNFHLDLFLDWWYVVWSSPMMLGSDSASASSQAGDHEAADALQCVVLPVVLRDCVLSMFKGG